MSQGRGEATESHIIETQDVVHTNGENGTILIICHGSDINESTITIISGKTHLVGTCRIGMEEGDVGFHIRRSAENGYGKAVTVLVKGHLGGVVT